MKKIFKMIVVAVAVVAAIWGAFYTEQLSERNKRLMMKQSNPEQLVATMLADSLASLQQRALTIAALAEGIAADNEQFAAQHGKTLGIGSPVFYVVADTLSNAIRQDNEVHATIGKTKIIIPLKYIFGNTARDASGWFCIDDFTNTMDFNAVSAAINKHIIKQLSMLPDSTMPGGFVGAVAVEADAKDIKELKIIPYELR